MKPTGIHNAPRVDKVWGHEVWIVNNDQYCGKQLHIKRGFQSSLHLHPKKHETFYVASGVVVLQTGDGEETLSAGDIVEIPNGIPHRFKGITNALVYEFSTHHDDDDVVRLDPSGRTP